MNPPNTGRGEGGGRKDECPICLCDYADPVITNCFHKFCEECITKSINALGTICPLCRTEPCEVVCPVQNVTTTPSSPELGTCEANCSCDRCFAHNFRLTDDAKREEFKAEWEELKRFSGYHDWLNQIPVVRIDDSVSIEVSSIRRRRPHASYSQERAPRRSRRPPPPARVATDVEFLPYSPGSSPFESGGEGRPAIDSNSVRERRIVPPPELYVFDDESSDEDFDLSWREGDPFLTFGNTEIR